jgi:polyphosphate glucokinase
MGVVIILIWHGHRSALFHDGVLREHRISTQIRGRDAEHRASIESATKGSELAEMADRVNEYLNKVEFLFSPDLLIVGGGVSKKHHKFLPLLNTRAEVVPAQLLNDAGIVGAALAARSLVS